MTIKKLKCVTFLDFCQPVFAFRQEIQLRFYAQLKRDAYIWKVIIITSREDKWVQPNISGWRADDMEIEL